MSSSERRSQELLEKLILDIKALVLLQPSDKALKEQIQAGIVRSNDESILKFVDSLQSVKKPGSSRLVVIALGELTFASLLVLVGAVALIPTVVGASTPADLVRYFADHLYGGIGNSPLSPYVSAIEFAIGAVLMLSAFYTLRQAAMNLKEAGLSIKSGEA